MEPDRSYDDADLEDDFLGAEPNYEGPVEPPANADHAERMLGRLARLRRDAAAAEAFAARRHVEIDEWVARRLFPLVTRMAWLEQALREYHIAVLGREPERKSIALPSGSLVSRMGQPTWEFHDEAAFLAWATENLPAAVRQKPPPPPEIDKAVAKDALTRRDAKGKPLEHGLTEGGERPPGLVVIPGERQYDVKPADEQEADRDD